MTTKNSKQRIKGRGEIVKAGDTPGGDCKAEDCPSSNREIISGMGIVFAAGKTYHLGCATRHNIDFKIPSPKPITRGKND